MASPDPPDPPLSGNLPGAHDHYQLLERIGDGGQGVVYLAESRRQLGQLLAVKFIREAAWQASPGFIDAFVVEALFGRELRSHNLGHTLDLLDLDRRGDTNGQPGTFCQIRHQSVRDYLLSADGPVPPNGVAEMHAAVGNYYLAEAGKQGWTKLDPYGRFFAVRHLLAAGDGASARLGVELLADLGFMQGTLGETAVETMGE